MKNYLEFFEQEADVSRQGTFVIEVPIGIQLKDELLAFFAQAGNFPKYFGRNWDALSDCLKDFCWISEQKIMIIHQDLPLQKDVKVCKVYLEILEDAVADWTANLKQSEDAAFVKNSQSHRLHVMFPIQTKSSISGFMKLQ